MKKTAGETAQAVYDAAERGSPNEADTVLLLARTNAYLLGAGVIDDAQELRGLLDVLLGLRIEGDGGWGWGLSEPWDAYGDGVVNPADTIYSYTTAAAALAFLDAHAVLGDQAYLDAAQQAVGALLDDTCCWTDGGYTSVWYDDQPNDQRPERQIHNVNGLTLAALSRLGRVTGDGEYADLTARMAAHLIDDQGRGYDQTRYGATLVSDWNWRYSQAEPGRPNDLIHETFIVEGLLAYGSEAALTAARRSLDGMVASHFDTGVPREGPYTFGSLGWGPGAALFVLSSSADHRDEARLVAQTVIQSISEHGTSQLAEAGESRAQAWYALGLARYANEKGWESSAVPQR